VRARAGGIRVGVVGVGYWGSRHVRVLRSTTGVAAVVGVDQRFAQIGDGRREPEHGIAAYADIGDALPRVDAVVIATPPASHAALALKAIAAGKHVLIEKPMATTSAEARRIVDAAAAAGVVLMPGHTFEHNAAVHKLRDLVREGHLGRLFYLDCARLNLGLYQADVNVIWDLAPHDISISNFVLGSRPTAVTVWGSRHVHPEHEDVAYLRLDYGDLGVRSHIHVSWLDPRKVRRITAVGDKKMGVYNDMADGDRIRSMTSRRPRLRAAARRCLRSPITWATWSRRSCRSLSRWQSRISTSSTASSMTRCPAWTVPAGWPSSRPWNAPRSRCGNSGQWRWPR
jgi:predicted dehydrogenase